MSDIDYGTKEIQNELLGMMKDVHEFCTKEEIAYSLSSGSVLGAVRHDGFIPWDDDIDIMMDRENYKKFLLCCNKFSGYDITRDSLWVYRINRKLEGNAKIHPTIDIFVMDNAPDNMFLRKLKVFLIKILQGMLKEERHYKNFSLPYKICLGMSYVIGRLFSRKIKLKMYDSISQLGNRKKTKYVSAYNDLFRCLKICYDFDTMQELVLHKFEDTEFFIPKKYDSYLTRQYGEYMVLPPENERVPMHM